MSLKDKFKKQNELLKSVKIKIRNTLDSDGWQIIERDLKDSLKNNYEQLIDVKPEKLKEKQMEIKMALDFIRSIYNMANLEWEYDGYREIKEPLSEDGDENKRQQEISLWARAIREEGQNA